MPAKRRIIARPRRAVFTAEVLRLFTELERTPMCDRRSEAFQARDRELARLLGLDLELICDCRSVLERDPLPPVASFERPASAGQVRVYAVRQELIAACRDAGREVPGVRPQAAAEALPFFEAEARKRQTGRPKAGEEKSAPIGAQLKHRAADDAAAAFGTPPRNVQAARACAVEATDLANLRPVGTNQYSEGVDTNNGIVNRRSDGNSAAAAMRRLRKDRPDLHARVLTGELTANGGMVEAGFRKKRQRARIAIAPWQTPVA
jgi:hypothetical protein